MSAKIPPGETVDTVFLYSKQDTALIGMLTECLSELAYREVDMSGIQHLEQDGWEAVSRLCAAERIWTSSRMRRWRRCAPRRKGTRK
jgi:hypothetical protein